MEQQPLNFKPLKASAWLLAALLLVAVFLINNRELLSGARVQTWDACSFYTPAFMLVADHARKGELLLWNPWLAAGTPDFADPQVAAASPVAIIVGLIGGGTTGAFRAYWLLIWMLGPLGLLLLARHLSVPAWGAFIVALGFAFCGFYTAHAEHTTILYSFSFVPWFIWRFDVALTSLRLRPAAEAGALWGLSALGGYPAIVILSGGMLFLWGLGRCCCSGNGDTLLIYGRPILYRFRFTFLALLVILLVGLAILAPTYLAFFKEALGYTERAGAMTRRAATAATQNALNPGAFATFASPYLTALKLLPGNAKLWPGSDPSVADVYIGVLPFILSLLALWQRPRSGWRWWLAGCIVFFLACAVGDRLPVRGWLYDYFPPTRYFTHPGIFRGYAMFSAMVLALLATRDLDAAISKPENRIWRHLLLVSLVASVVAAGVYARALSHIVNLGNQIGLSNLHLIGIWFGAVGVSLSLLLFWGTRKWLAILFGVVAILDAALTLRLSQDFMSDGRQVRALLGRVDAGHKTSLTQSSLRRELETPSLFGGGNQNHNVSLRIAAFYNQCTMKNRFHIWSAQHPVLLNMGLGADRIWFSKDAAIAAPSDLAYLALTNRSEQLGAPVLVVIPPSEMVKDSRLGWGGVADKAQLAAISRLAPAQNIPVEVLKYTPNDLKLKVSCPADGWLAVTDRWAAGWRAKVNGIPVEVFGGNFIFRAVRVRAGENTVQFYYPQHLYFALVLLSWSTLVGVFTIPRLNGIRGGGSRQLRDGCFL